MSGMHPVGRTSDPWSMSVPSRVPEAGSSMKFPRILPLQPWFCIDNIRQNFWNLKPGSRLTQPSNRHSELRVYHCGQSWPERERASGAEAAPHSVLSPRALSLQMQKALLSWRWRWWAQAAAVRCRSRCCAAARWCHVDQDLCRSCRSE